MIQSITEATEESTRRVRDEAEQSKINYFIRIISLHAKIFRERVSEKH